MTASGPSPERGSGAHTDGGDPSLQPVERAVLNRSAVAVLQTHTTMDEGVAFIEVTGEIDLSSAEELRETVLAAMTPAVGTIRIDLSGVTFMDSTGLAALIAARNAAGAHYSVIAQNPQPQVRRVFEVTGLNTVFNI